MQFTRITFTVAILAACAVWAWHPPRREDLLRSRATGRSRGVPGWLAPRPGAPGAATRRMAGLAAASAVLVALPGLVALLVAPVVGGAVTVALGQVETGRRRREQAAAGLALPETFDLLSASLEAGAPLRHAVAQVGQTGPEATRGALSRVDAMVRVGISDAEAWRSLADDEHWGRAARDLARSSETGTAAAAQLRQLAADARDTRRDDQLKRARAVGVRSVLPLMCCFLPAFLLTGVVPIVAGLLGSVLHR